MKHKHSTALTRFQNSKGSNIKLHGWQQENVEFIEKNKFVIIADEMGLGKTFSALAAVKKNKLYPCLILCPKALKVNWQREIKRIDHMKSVEILGGTKKDSLPKELNGRFSKDYTILQYDAKNLIPELPMCKSIILDEVHYLKSYKSIRTVVTMTYIREKSNAIFAIGLSGTPILNKGAEIFTVANVLHGNIKDGKIPDHFDKSVKPAKYVGGQYLGTDGLLTWDEFYGNGSDKFTYPVYQNPRNPDAITGYMIKNDKLTDLNKMLKDKGIMIRHTKSLLKDLLPPKIKLPVILKQPNGYLKEVNRLDAIYGGLKIASLTKIRQWLAEEKVPDVVEYVEDITNAELGDKTNVGEKVIVFGNYIDATNLLAEKLGVKAHTSELTSPEERQKIIDEFTSDQQHTKVLVMTIRTGNVGLNLTQANHVVFNDYSYSPSDMMQAEDRAHRLGQTKTVTIHYISSAGTVDEDALDLLTKKQKVLNGIIDGTPYTYDEKGIEQSVLDKLKLMIKSQKVKKTKTAKFKQKIR